MYLITVINQFKTLKNSNSTSYDAIVVGSGPNGLAAAIRLAQEGLHVKIFEAADTVGGGTRTKEIIRPGYLHDICSAVHPMGISSPFFKQLPLEKFGLKWIHPIHPAAHPMDDGPAAILYNDLHETAFHLQEDEKEYLQIAEPITKNWDKLTGDFLGPLSIPSHPFKLASFGLKGLQPASLFQTRFQTERAKALFGGMAAHSLLPLHSMATTAIGLVFFGAAHTNGWPVAAGGSQAIANALASYFTSLNGEIETGFRVERVSQLPKAKAVLFDLTPRQVARIAGDDLSPRYKKKLRNFRLGSGVFKIDYILKEPVPWKDTECQRAGTVHVGGTFQEIAESEKSMNEGRHPKKPFVLVAQQSLFDSERTGGNGHTLWAYCHVPNGSTRDMTEEIENQIERFAPGFRDVIDEKRTMNCSDFEEYNANYIGGDINGGMQNLRQLFSRPVSFVNPYATPAKGLYFCSSSTPPGGGVHGMCGYHAANLALKKEFGIR
ncbi:MAG: NAD(P)/FAD-dependent oxidoreductase [Balneolaceae bacterium]|nr:MAG: NAD(P)/FAD-dependent oxidoreductase [Balneolaceae bacterium]